MPMLHKAGLKFVGFTWTLKICKGIAFLAVSLGLGLLFVPTFGVSVGLRGLGFRIWGSGV